MEYKIECEKCGWQGDASELVCSDEDDKSNKPVSEIKFNRCPDCYSMDIVDFEEDEEE